MQPAAALGGLAATRPPVPHRRPQAFGDAGGFFDLGRGHEFAQILAHSVGDIAGDQLARSLSGGLTSLIPGRVGCARSGA